MLPASFFFSVWHSNLSCYKVDDKREKSSSTRNWENYATENFSHFSSETFLFFLMFR